MRLIAMTLHPFRLLLLCSSSTSQNSKKNKVQVLTKTRSLLEQTGLGVGKPMQNGVGHTGRDLCDGQTLASPGRWPPAMRRFPRSDSWKAQKVLRMFRNGKALDGAGTGSSQGMPFPERCCERTQRRSRGCAIVTWKAVTATKLPIDFRFLDLLLRASEDPDTQLGTFAQGVKVGPCTRMPRYPTLYRPKRKWDELATRGRETVGVPMEAELRIVGRFRRQG